MKGPTHTQETIDRVMSLYRKSYSGRKIAELVELPHSTVHRIISSNTVKMTNRKETSAEPKKQISKTAKAVIQVSTRHTFTPFTVPTDAPICNATVMSSEPYRCPELSYRQSARA